MQAERYWNVLWWISFFLGGLLLLVHFSLVQMSNMPQSPLKLRMSNLVSAYVNPFFSQRWNFFAPQPLDRDYILLARGRYHDANSGQLVTSDWLDVSDALIGSLRRNRLTALFHVEICLSNALVQLVGELGKDPLTSFSKEGKVYLKSEVPPNVDSSDMEVSTRVALAALEIAHPENKFQEVQIGILVYEFPRFTERQKPVSDTPATLIRVDWQPAEWVSPYCCWTKAATASLMK